MPDDLPLELLRGTELEGQLEERQPETNERVGQGAGTRTQIE